MSVTNGQAVNQTVSNAAWISKNTDDTMSNKLGLNRPTSGSSIADIQQATNTLYTCTGSSETATGTVYNSTPNTISNGDSHLVAFQKLAAKFDAATGHRHTGNPGDAPAVSAGGISSVPLLGYIEQGTNVSGATGSSTDVSSLLNGKVASSGSTVAGIPTTSPYNKVLLQYGSGSALGQNIIDSSGNLVYGRLTHVSSTWTLSYYSLVAGSETTYSFGSSTTLQWYYQELFNPLSAPPVYSQVPIVPGANPTAAVLQSGSNIFGKVALSATAGADIASSGAIGTQNGYVANSDHTHKGVHSVAATGNSGIYGDAILSTGGSMSLSQSGQVITISDTLSSSTPADVASAGVIGAGTTVARADHVHKGLHSIAASGNSALYGDVLLQAGSNLTLTQTGQNILIALSGGVGTGTVTSVGLSLPAELTVSGSPVSTSGTLTAVWANQNANFIFAGPASGSASTPLFRRAVRPDISAAYISPTVQKFTSGSGTYNKTYLFTVISANATAGATYTNNGITYTVVSTISSATTLQVTGTGDPTASGTLTKSSGTGDSTITFTAFAAPVFLQIRMVGAGGQGGGGGTGSPTVGTTGGSSTFSVHSGAAFLTAGGGGGGGIGANGAAGSGGTATISSPAYGTGVTGGGGQANTTALSGFQPGAMGGSSALGGAGVGQSNGVGLSGVTNTGGGGGGGGCNASGSAPGGGGGSGAFIHAIIPSPVSAQYDWAVGAPVSTGGAAGTNGYAAGPGGSGYIEVTEHYQ